MKHLILVTFFATCLSGLAFAEQVKSVDTQCCPTCSIDNLSANCRAERIKGVDLSKGTTTAINTGSRSTSGAKASRVHGE